MLHHGGEEAKSVGWYSVKMEGLSARVPPYVEVSPLQTQVGSKIGIPQPRASVGHVSQQ